jgi:hypothetical protein
LASNLAHQSLRVNAGLPDLAGGAFGYALQGVIRSLQGRPRVSVGAINHSAVRQARRSPALTQPRQRLETDLAQETGYLLPGDR